MAAKQGIIKRAIRKDRPNKFVKKYSLAQTAKSNNEKQTTKYSYSKKLVTKSKYSYKR